MYGREIEFALPFTTVQDEFQSKRCAVEHNLRSCRWIQDCLALAGGAGTTWDATEAQNGTRAARGYGAHVRQVINNLLWTWRVNNAV